MADSIIDPFGSEHYGYIQQNTRCKVLVYSHIVDNPYKGQIDCSLDTISCSTSKTIKGGGQAAITLVPRKNYLNLIFPNDYVNIYFDPGDGRGYIRTFFGFVDRISRSISTDTSTGATNTTFQIQCSDFTKAFDKTIIYFNQLLAKREDTDNEWQGAGNIGGIEVMMRGVALHGSPADIVMSLAHLMLSYNSQFLLPESYPLSENKLYANRRMRQEWARSRLSETIQTEIGQSEITAFEEQILSEAKNVAKQKLTFYEDLENYKDLTEKETQIAVADILKRKGLPHDLFQSQEWLAATTIAKTTVAGSPRSFLDLLDFRYIEWKSIDGYVLSVPIAQAEGSVWSMMNSWSNEMLNELFCDLRPMPSDITTGGASSGGSKQDKEFISGNYSSELDEIGGNTGGGASHSIRFAPCLIMREYPFGTIEGVSPPQGLLILGEQLSQIYIGALFSQEPGKPGRKVVTIPAAHPALILKEQGRAEAYKHLDVSVISVNDITQEQIGRSDNTHSNFLEVYSDINAGGIGSTKTISIEVQPIISKINVMRHGLRLRSHQTKFCRFSAEQKWISLKNALQEVGASDHEIDIATKEYSLSGIDGFWTRRLAIRWAIMLDHFYQHDIEYLSGTISTRAFPEVRVGNRLDILERHESYYVEGVDHSWTYPNAMQTTFTVSRGQRWDPYPVYTLPSSGGFGGIRGKGSRLGEFFHVLDTSATARAFIGFGEAEEITEGLKNLTDTPMKQTWAVKSKKGYLVSDSTAPSDALDKSSVETLINKAFSSLTGLTNKANDIISEAAQALSLPGDVGGGKE